MYAKRRFFKAVALSDICDGAAHIAARPDETASEIVGHMPPKTKLGSCVGINRHIAESAAQMGNKVKTKATKLSKYKEKYSEIALLIVLDRTYDSGMFHPIADEIVTPNCGFSSVYLALYPENYIKIG